MSNVRTEYSSISNYTTQAQIVHSVHTAIQVTAQQTVPNFDHISLHAYMGILL